MKFRTTRKDVTFGYARKICVGYADLQHLLVFTAPVAYTTGVYGWNADIYDVGDNTCIVTGYRSFGNIHPSYNLVSTYNRMARDVFDNTTMPFEQKREKIHDLLNEFIEQCIEGKC